MNHINLKLIDFSRLSSIQAKLAKNLQPSESEMAFLADFLEQLPNHEELLSAKIPLNRPIPIQIWDNDQTMPVLKTWQDLFQNIPGFDFVGCYPFEVLDNQLLKQGVVMNVVFAPTLSYNLVDGNDGLELYLKDNGFAEFRFHTLQDAEAYPELYNFKGSWKEAYYLLIETLKKGWPIEEFPEELQQFLKK